LRLIKENPDVTTEELAGIIGITSKGVEWQTKKLKDDGIIKRVGSAKGRHWEIIKNKGRV